MDYIKLFSGTYPGAVISVKNEGNKASATYVSSTPVKPIKPALSSPTLSTTIDKQTLPVSRDTQVKPIKQTLSTPISISL